MSKQIPPCNNWHKIELSEFYHIQCFHCDKSFDSYKERHKAEKEAVKHVKGTSHLVTVGKSFYCRTCANRATVWKDGDPKPSEIERLNNRKIIYERRLKEVNDRIEKTDAFRIDTKRWSEVDDGKDM